LKFENCEIEETGELWKPWIFGVHSEV
jgi:hypothetical protein